MIVSVMLLLRVLFCGFNNLDIPKLSSSGISFGKNSFCHVHTIKSSSMYFVLLELFDANELEEYIRKIEKDYSLF